MIDQHLIELQLLNSAVVVKNEGRMNGVSGPDRLSRSLKLNGHSAAAAAAAVENEKVARRKKPGGRRGLSDADQFNKAKHHRRPSDIDSLSPEVLKALQSTFGGKLDEIRSKFWQHAPSPPPSPPPRRLREPTPPPSPPGPPPPAATDVKDQRTFVERLADREGAYMLIAYFSAIFLSGFILLAAEENDGDSDSQEEPCGGMGVIPGKCARLFGVILPTGLTAAFFTLALVFFVFDVSYSLFNILMAARDVLSDKKTKFKNTPTLVSEKKNSVKLVKSGSPRLIFVIDLAFIVASSALLWISKTATTDPVHTVCGQRQQLIWMLGLMLIDVVILLSAIKSFKDPQISNACIRTAAKQVSVIFCLLLACSAAYKYAALESEEVIVCAHPPPASSTFKEIQVYEPLQLCFSTTPSTARCAEREVPELLQCLWWPHSRNRGRHLDLCEANGQCDWPRAKRIQVYERKDVCTVGLPQCDWPLLKQIQPYEDKDRCYPQGLRQCDWPVLKQVQLYENEERCRPHDFSSQNCDWPWLKQVQLFEAQDRCSLKNPEECEWPLLKQVQLFGIEDRFSSQGMCRCRWRGRRRARNLRGECAASW